MPKWLDKLYILSSLVGALGLRWLEKLNSWGLHMYTLTWERHPRKTLLFGVILAIWTFGLPNPLFTTSYSQVLEDRQGRLLGARIAGDGQWRFPMADSLPYTYVASLIEFEDRRFWYHPGIDPVGLLRAIRQNMAGGKVVSGGSTLSMQCIRMSDQGAKRSIWQKAKEAFWATRLEWRHSKSEILRLYAAHAPFGGNVVGLEAACWRYYGKSPAQLSWGEAATLAVLPNSPALIHPGRNRGKLLAKRNRLIVRLEQKGVLDAQTSALAQAEPLPDKPLALPMLAPALLDRMATTSRKGARHNTSIDGTLQQQVNEVVSRHLMTLSGNGIHNAAVLVSDVETGEVLAYVGNDPNQNREHQGQVDIIRAQRSTGSTLKPFLYAQMLQAGELLPTAIIKDVPTNIDGYKPENYLETFDGMVTARRALGRSLNIPFVNMLKDFGVSRFHFLLKKMGFKSINQAPDYYGLTLILGGAECTLWELGSAYTNLSRVAKHYYPYQGKYDPKDWHDLRLTHETTKKGILEDWQRQSSGPIVNAAAAWCTLDALTAVERPDAEGNWELFQTSRRVAWKTGTSLGFRDAWSIGTTPRYTVAVWVGNADGEGRPGLVGVEVAAPLMFDVFNLLPPDGAWFDAPYDEMAQIPVCKQSGFRASEHCAIDSVWAPSEGLRMRSCNFCRLIHYDATQNLQVTTECATPDEMRHVPQFVLPPLEEFYYAPRHAEYRQLPPFRTGCVAPEDRESIQMQIIYPQSNARLYLPTELDGSMGKAIFRAAHRSAEQTLQWYIDDTFMGETTHFHSFETRPSPGEHTLTVVDKAGHREKVRFTVLEKN